MTYFKKSLGQNFLKDKNIILKIINLINLKNKNIIEIGPGKGALTDKILEKRPKTLKIIEKDDVLSDELKKKYIKNKDIKIYNKDILKFNIEKIIEEDSIIIGNLPYNISSQILVKFLKLKNWPPKICNFIFMFQKEVGERIIGEFNTSDYGRLSILSNFRLKVKNYFFVSPNCFFPRPKVTSMVIQFQPINRKEFSIKKINNLEKITNIFFSNKRKMINKCIKKVLSEKKIKKIPKIKLDQRPADLRPEIYYKITELFELG